MQMKLWILLFITLAGSNKNQRTRNRWDDSDYHRRKYRSLERRLNNQEQAIDDLVIQLSQTEQRYRGMMDNLSITVEERLRQLNESITNSTIVQHQLTTNDMAKTNVTLEKLDRRNKSSRARRSRIIVAGGVYNRQSAFYRRTDSVTFSISQDKIILDQQQSLHYMRSHCCGVILDGRFHLLGGQTKQSNDMSGDVESNIHQVYVPNGKGGTWEFGVPMSQKRESFVCNIYRGRIWACGGENKQFSPTRTCESWLPGEMSWRQEQSMNELRFMGTSAVTPVGLFALGGNVAMLDNPRSVEYLPIVTGMKWQFGPEPSILRGTIGSASVTINNDIYLMSGWEHISHRLRSEIIRLPYSDDIGTSQWIVAGRMKTARFGALALPLVNQFVLLGGKSNATHELSFAQLFTLGQDELQQTEAKIRLRNRTTSICPSRMFFAGGIL